MAKGDFRKRYNELMSTHDYRGLASLLRNTSYKDDDARQRAFDMADKFEEEADISDKLLENATVNQRAAYNFVANGPTKPQDGTEPDIYTKGFSDAWNNLANEDGQIKVSITETSLNKFLSGAGMSLDELENYNIQRSTTNDGSFLIFNTDNPYKVQIANGLFNIDTYEDYRGIKYNGLDTHRTTVHIPTVSKKEYNVNPANTTHPLSDLYDVVQQANNSYYELMNKTQPYVLQTVVTGYMGEDDKQLQQAFAAGAIDLQTFKESRKLLEEKYNRLLQTKSLSQYHVFSMNENNEGSEFLEELSDNILKSHLDEEINLAMTEGRLHFSHASNGVMYGTMITIDQRYDTKKNAMEEYPARRFFVQDLFKSEAENSLRQDTQVDAQLQYDRHQTYGHVYRAKDGGILENWNGQYDNVEYVDEFGNRRVVSKAEALNIMDDDIIARRLINYYKKANLRDKNGRIYTEEGTQIYGNGGMNLEVLENNIKQRALQITADKYGDPNSDYVKIKANKLASTIMKIVTKDLNI